MAEMSLRSLVVLGHLVDRRDIPRHCRRQEMRGLWLHHHRADELRQRGCHSLQNRLYPRDLSLHQLGHLVDRRL